MTTEKKVRVRFAPSPTGELHIGGLKIALTDYLFAKKNNGKFVLRIEDTDRKRFVEGSTERIIESLNWAGIKIDEGPKLENGKIVEEGEFGPYTQSERVKVKNEELLKMLEKHLESCDSKVCENVLEELKTKSSEEEINIYDIYAGSLLKENKAGYCNCNTEENSDGKCKNCTFTIGKKVSGEPLRLNCEICFSNLNYSKKFNDLIFGEVNLDFENLKEERFVLIKSDGFPTYHFASVVDDHLMGISHVFRGAEWLPSTPKHILLYDAFGWEAPKFCHMPNILNKNKKKLSKREGSVSVMDFKNQGYPKEAILNFIALLGWNPKTEKEIFTLNELVDEFESVEDIEKNGGLFKKMNKAGGVFDLDRLAWISREHIKKMEINDLYSRILPFLEQKDFYKNSSILSEMSVEEKENYLKKIVEIEKERMNKFSEIGEENQFFFTDKIQVDKDLIRWKDNSDEATKENLEKAKEVLVKIDEKDWTKENLEKVLLEVAGDKRGDLLFPLRGSLTGAKKSPSPFECLWVLGKEESLRRVERGIEVC